MDWQALLEICHGAFSYDRFHRDFNLDSARADARYDKWLYQLYEQKAVYGLFWRGELSGFIAISAESWCYMRLLRRIVVKVWRNIGGMRHVVSCLEPVI